MIDPSVKAVLRSKYSIRRFFILFAVLLAVLLLLLVLITAYVPQNALREASVNFLGNFAATVAIFIFTYAFFVFITSPELRNAEVIPLRNVEISGEILDLPAEASDYWFWGRTGSYFRTAVLPRLDDLAKTERRRIRIRVVIPDPDREGNSELYMHFKKGLGEEAGLHTLSANVVLTVASVVATVLRNPYLDAEIGLCSSVPVLRYDLSNAGAMLTRDAKNLPAILVNAGNPYFEMFKDAVENELAQSKKVSWRNATEAPNLGADLDDLFLRSIDGLPHIDDKILCHARTFSQVRAHRYAS